MNLGPGLKHLDLVSSSFGKLLAGQTIMAVLYFVIEY